MVRLKLKKTLAFFMLVILANLLVSLDDSNRQKGVKAGYKYKIPTAVVGKQYALLIAINSYQHWQELCYPVADTKELEDILKKNYHFDEIHSLYDKDATIKNINEKFKYLQGRLKEDDSLFIFYAGHGYLDIFSDTGYWIPVDGGSRQSPLERWLPNGVIRGFISKMKARHILLISDSCFSGSLFNTYRGVLPAVTDGYLNKANANRSREVITSVGLKLAPDKSPFSRHLILALKENRSHNLDSITLFTEIDGGIRKKTNKIKSKEELLPIYGTLLFVDHEIGGRFIFFRRDAGTESVPPPDKPISYDPAILEHIKTIERSEDIDDSLETLKQIEKDNPHSFIGRAVKETRRVLLFRGFRNGHGLYKVGLYPAAVEEFRKIEPYFYEPGTNMGELALARTAYSCSDYTAAALHYVNAYKNCFK